MKLNRINYRSLNSRQQETYNFQKVSSILAEYGFATIKLNDDWQGADFIAQHIDGETYLKVQLKSRLTFDRKYINKDLYICFPDKEDWYMYNHDTLLNTFLINYSDKMAKTNSWNIHGSYTWPGLSKQQRLFLNEYKLNKMTATDFWDITDSAQNPLVEVEMSTSTHSYILETLFSAPPLPNSFPSAINGVNIRHNDNISFKSVILRYQNGNFSSPIAIV